MSAETVGESQTMLITENNTVSEFKSRVWQKKIPKTNFEIALDVTPY